MNLIWKAPDEKAIRALKEDFCREYENSYPKAVECLEEGFEDSIGFYAFEELDSRKISSTNTLERLNREIRKRSSVVGIFPSTDSYIRLITSLKNRKSKESDNKDTDLSGYDKDDFDEVYLFFDYDIQELSKTNKKSLREQNEDIKQMLEYFNNETRHEKLYINYPMIESLRYFKKELPDENFYKYTSSVFLQRDFKKKVHCISF